MSGLHRYAGRDVLHCTMISRLQIQSKMWSALEDEKNKNYNKVEKTAQQTISNSNFKVVEDCYLKIKKFIDVENYF